MNTPRITAEEPALSLEVVILLILGLFMTVFGLLLFLIGAGLLPYSPNSAYGLFLVIVAFQIIAMGKTPFGDLRRSWAVVMAGAAVALVGMFSCFVPGPFAEPARILVGAVLLAGGASLLLQLLLSESKARVWMKAGGALRELTWACGAVYALTMLTGAVTLLPGVVPVPQTAALLIVYGTSIFHLSCSIRKVAKAYPAPEASADRIGEDGRGDDRCVLFRTAALPLSLALPILLGILLTLLGLLLVPVNLGLLTFSPDGQFGLLLTIMAIQMMALGETPLGQWRRRWPLIALGMAFAAFGIVSSIVPGLLTGVVQVFLGLLNIIGGAAPIIGRYRLRRIHGHDSRTTTHPAREPADIGKQEAVPTALNALALVFGLSMLIPGLIPGLAIAGILIVYGLLLFVLVSVAWRTTRRRQNAV